MSIHDVLQVQEQFLNVHESNNNVVDGDDNSSNDNYNDSSAMGAVTTHTTKNSDMVDVSSENRSKIPIPTHLMRSHSSDNDDDDDVVAASSDVVSDSPAATDVATSSDRTSIHGNISDVLRAQFAGAHEQLNSAGYSVTYTEDKKESHIDSRSINNEDGAVSTGDTAHTHDKTTTSTTTINKNISDSYDDLFNENLFEDDPFGFEKQLKDQRKHQRIFVEDKHQ